MPVLMLVNWISLIDIGIGSPAARLLQTLWPQAQILLGHRRPVSSQPTAD